MFETTRELDRLSASEYQKLTQEFACSDEGRAINDNREFANELADQLNDRIRHHNNVVPGKGMAWAHITSSLPDAVVATCMIERNNIIRMASTSEIEKAPLAIYCDERVLEGDVDDERYGTYVTDEAMIARVAAQYSPNLTSNAMRNIKQMLYAMAPIKTPCTTPSYSIFANGILDRDTRELIPFSPDIIVTSKCAVRYNPDAKMPRIKQADGTYWTPDQFLPSFTSDPEIAKLLMQGIAATLRPFHGWKQMLLLYSTVGNNGKGTYCALLNNLIGSHAAAHLNINDMSKEYHLGQILHATAIIADENPVGTYVDSSDALKCIVTQDPVLINVKYQNPLSYVFHGMVVQCINELPKIRDRTGSFARRLLFVPFDQCFTGRENIAIKRDYIARQDVLEWFAKVAMDLDFDEIKEPESSRLLKEEYKEANDPVREFANEILSQYSWDLIPDKLAYQQYKTWFAKNVPSGTVLGRNNFFTQWRQIAYETGEWLPTKKNVRIAERGRMVGPEMTILTYYAEDFINKSAEVSNRRARCTRPADTAGHRWSGILRKNSKGKVPGTDAEYEDSSINPTTPDELNDLLSAMMATDENGNSLSCTLSAKMAADDQEKDVDDATEKTVASDTEETQDAEKTQDGRDDAEPLTEEELASLLGEVEELPSDDELDALMRDAEAVDDEDDGEDGHDGDSVGDESLAEATEKSTAAASGSSDSKPETKRNAPRQGHGGATRASRKRPHAKGSQRRRRNGHGR